MRSLGILVPLLVLVACAGAFQQPVVKADGKELLKLNQLEKAQAAAKKAYKAKPTSAKLKKAYIDASIKAGHAFMVTLALPPRVKYPRSLKYFREARKVDPKNADANKNIKMMEDIYKSMGRPIPPG